MAAIIRFVVVCVLGKRITVTEEYWQKIITIKHPSMAGRDAQVQETLTDPDEVRESRSDTRVKLYYRRYANLHFTDRIKEGATVWTKF